MENLNVFFFKKWIEPMVQRAFQFATGAMASYLAVNSDDSNST